MTFCLGQIIQKGFKTVQLVKCSMPKKLWSNTNGKLAKYQSNLEQILEGMSTYPWEQCVETVHFLSFCHIGIVLSDAFQCQLIHQIDFIWLLKVFGLHNGTLAWLKQMNMKNLNIVKCCTHYIQDIWLQKV